MIFLSLEAERNENEATAMMCVEEDEESVFLVNEQELNLDYESNDESYESTEGYL